MLNFQLNKEIQMAQHSTDIEPTISIQELGPHEATIDWNGCFTLDGAARFSKILDNLFGYYLYRSVTVNLESPGGQVVGLDYMLRAVDSWKRKGRNLAVRSTFECASAAALFLSYGKWGSRTVDKQTNLVFHGARFDPRSFSEFSAISSSLASRHMSEMDNRIVEHLTTSLTTSAGSAEALRSLLFDRIQYVASNWEEIVYSMSSLTFHDENTRKPQWIKSIQKVGSTSDPKAFLPAYIGYLSRRFQSDSRMDLREAYSLCLIDEVGDVPLVVEG